MLNNSQPNRNLFLCSVLFLASILTITYIPGFASITYKKYQPALITSDIWIDNADITANGTDINDTSNLNDALRLISMHVFFGWRRAYYVQGDKKENVKKLIDKDLHIAGLIYLYFSAGSLLLFGLAILSIKCKNKFGVSFFMILSWLCLVTAVVVYVINFEDSVINDFLSDAKAELNSEINSALDDLEEIIEDQFGEIIELSADVDFGWHWRFGTGLIANIAGILLLPVINVILCV